MKILLAGASGAIGRPLVPMLVGAGHEVTGMIRNPAHAAALAAAGAKAVIADAFDRDAVFAAIRETRPEVVIHQLTSLGGGNFAENARIRKEGTRHLADASLHYGVERMIAQSISWVYPPGDGPATEDEPLDPDEAQPRKNTVDGVRALESAVAELPRHVVLRYGLLYGPGTWYAPDGLIADQVRQGGLPATEGVSSFVHTADAARAALLALDWPGGVYNIVDDEPAPGTVWLPYYARTLGAPEPPAKPGGGAAWERGALNGKAARQGWRPAYGSWREGFRAEADSQKAN